MRRISILVAEANVAEVVLAVLPHAVDMTVEQDEMNVEIEAPTPALSAKRSIELFHGRRPHSTAEFPDGYSKSRHTLAELRDIIMSRAEHGTTFTSTELYRAVGARDKRVETMLRDLYEGGTLDRKGQRYTGYTYWKKRQASAA